MIMVQVSADRTKMTAFGRQLVVSCKVRNELNGQRGMNEVVYSENEDGSQGVPYMPRQYPSGTWTISKPVQELTDIALGPWFTPTSACQLVDEWEVVNKVYTQKTGRQVMDYGYGIHISYRMLNGAQVEEAYSDGCLHFEDGNGSTKEEVLDWWINQVITFLADPARGTIEVSAE